MFVRKILGINQCTYYTQLTFLLILSNGFAHEGETWYHPYNLEITTNGMIYHQGTWDDNKLTGNWNQWDLRPATDIWGFSHNSKDYAVTGTIEETSACETGCPSKQNGMVSIVDVTDPRKPILSGIWDSGLPTDINDVKTIGDIGFFASYGSPSAVPDYAEGIFIVKNLTSSNPETVVRIMPSVDFGFNCQNSPGEYDVCSPRIHNLSVTEDYIYAAAFSDIGSANIYIYHWEEINGDVVVTFISSNNYSDPDWENHLDGDGNWQFSIPGSIATNPRRIHDVTVSNDGTTMFVTRNRQCWDSGNEHPTDGKNIFVCDGGITQILDLSDPEYPQSIGNVYLPSNWDTNTENLIDLGTIYIYKELSRNNPNHTMWPSEDGKFLYAAGEAKGSPINVFNIEDPSNTQLVKEIYPINIGLNEHVTIHNMVVNENYLYVAWYGEGMVLFNISDPSNPIKIGQWDGYSDEVTENDPQYGSIWGVYPFLGKDKILISDLEHGIHVVSVGAPLVPTILAPLLLN